VLEGRSSQKTFLAELGELRAETNAGGKPDDEKERDWVRKFLMGVKKLEKGRESTKGIQ